ncbi:MAG: hypothetical protein R3E39_09815 [Anaerolineae bacterium]
MPVTVQWDTDSNSAIIYTISEHWTWDEVRAAWNAGRDLVSSVPHKVDFILNLEHSIGIPSGSLVKSDHIFRNRLPNARHIVIVSGGGLVNMLITSFKTLRPGSGQWVHSAPSLAHARAKLAQFNHPGFAHTSSTPE